MHETILLVTESRAFRLLGHEGLKMLPINAGFPIYELMTSWQEEDLWIRWVVRHTDLYCPSDLMNPSFSTVLFVFLCILMQYLIFTAMVYHNMLWLQFPHYLIMDLKTSFKIRTFKMFLTLCLDSLARVTTIHVPRNSQTTEISYYVKKVFQRPN